MLFVVQKIDMLVRNTQKSVQLNGYKKLREGYRRRGKKQLKCSLLNRQVHAICYKSFVYDLKKVSNITKTERPRLMKN